MVILVVVSLGITCCGNWAILVKDEARRTVTMRSEIVYFFIGIPPWWTWGVLIHKDISIIIQRKIKK
jgi:hypothetical protein